MEITLKLLGESAKAYKVTQDEKTELWIPKSQCSVDDPHGVVSGRIYEFDIPEWLAKEKGFI